MRKTEWYTYGGLLARSYNISSQDHFWRSQERCRRAGEEQTHCMQRTRESLSTWRSTFHLLHASCRRRSSCVSTDLRHISTDPIILTTLALPVCIKKKFYTVNRGICCRDCSAFFRPCFQRHGSQAAVITVKLSIIGWSATIMFLLRPSALWFNFFPEDLQLYFSWHSRLIFFPKIWRLRYATYLQVCRDPFLLAHHQSQRWPLLDFASTHDELTVVVQFFLEILQNIDKLTHFSSVPAQTLMSSQKPIDNYANIIASGN